MSLTGSENSRSNSSVAAGRCCRRSRGGAIGSGGLATKRLGLVDALPDQAIRFTGRETNRGNTRSGMIDCYGIIADSG